MKEMEMEVQEVQQPVRRKAPRLMSMLMALCLVMGLAVPCFATGETSGVDSVMGSFDTIATLINKVFTLVTENWYLALYLVLGLLGIGLAAFVKMKNAAH